MILIILVDPIPHEPKSFDELIETKLGTVIKLWIFSPKIK